MGASGTVAGVTELELDEAGPAPAIFVAVTVNVYAVPFVRPVIIIGEALPISVLLSGLLVTV